MDAKQFTGRQGRHEQAVAPEFNLLRYFLFTSLWLFVGVLIALHHHENGQREFFSQVQEEQDGFLAGIQDGFVATQEEEARRALLAIHEAGNVNIARLFANALWERDFGPFVTAAQARGVEACRAMPDAADAQGRPVAPPEKKACFAAFGQWLMGLPRFQAIDAKVFDMMQKSTVFKIKVFDLRGITVYSSEHPQIGEDKRGNQGWQAAAAGRPASELTHRDRFSAFEGVVENRDLISSYLPMFEPGADRVVGVFEIYSDVTPFMAQIAATTGRIRAAAADNQTKMRAVTQANQERVAADSTRGQLVVIGLLAVLFLALFLIVRNAHLLIRRQQAEKTRAQQQLAQAEKMAALGQMVAGVAHQLNTPLAFSRNNVAMAIEQLAAWEAAGAAGGSPGELRTTREMLGDVLHGVAQMAELVRHMRSFTHLDRSKIGEVDLNDILRSVVYIARSVISSRIEVVEDYGDLQGRPCRCVPSQINQVVLNLLTNAAQAIGTAEGRIVVRTRLVGERFRVDVEDNGQGIAPAVLPHIFEPYYTTKGEEEGTGLGLPIAREIVANHRGEFAVESRPGCTIFTFFLPLRLDDASLLG